MGLSSNVFWHQTTKDGAIAIMQNRKINYSYSLETIYGLSARVEGAFPMISFFNLPLSDLEGFLTKTDPETKAKTYEGKYGEFIFGFSNNWGRIVGLSPVWYRDNCSVTMDVLMESVGQHVWGKIKSKEHIDLLWNTMSYTKNFEGDLSKYGLVKYRFYDEHEWRIVPSIEDLKNIGQYPDLNPKEYEEYKKNHKNSLIDSLSVPFEYSDLRYILYYNEEDFKELKKILPQDTLNNITCLSYKQLLEDCIGIRHDVAQ